MIHLIAALLVFFLTPVLLALFWGAFGFGKWGLVIAYIGNLSNLLAMASNGMRMPVIGYDLQPGLLWVSGYNANLPWVCDRFPIGAYVFSMGDFIIGAGVIVGITWFIMSLINSIRER